MKLTRIISWHVGASLIYIFLYGISMVIWPDLDVHRIFSIYTGLIFCVLSFIIIYSSSRFVNHRNPYYFSWVTLISVLVKLGIGIGMIIYYTRKHELPNRLYVISFILSYVIFTVCEVWLLQMMIKQAKKSWSK